MMAGLICCYAVACGTQRDSSAGSGGIVSRFEPAIVRNACDARVFQIMVHDI